MFATKPALVDEVSCWERGERLVGVDEVGRGALAGPLVAAAVSLPPWADAAWLADVRDSKLLSRKQIACLAAVICFWCPPVDIGYGWISSFSVVIFDGNRGLEVDGVESRTRIKGDQTVASISVASIVAKAYRDRYMRADAHDMWPQYGFAQNVGYGTPQHLAALREQGPCPIHRRSFSPVKEMP